MKKFVIILIFTLSLIWVGCGGDPETKASMVSNAKNHRELIARGEFGSLEEVFLSPPMRTEVVEMVEEGHIATPGEEVAKLSPGDRLEKILERSAQLERSSMQLELKKVKLRMAKGIENKKLELAELELQKSKIELERELGSRDWLRIVDLEESLKTHKIRAKLLNKKLAATRKMLGKGFVAKQELLETEKELAVLQVTSSLTARLIPFLEGTPEEKSVQKAREKFENKRLEYEVASYTYAKNIAEYDYEKKEAYGIYTDNASRVALLEKEVASLSVIAEKSGVIIYGNSFDGAELVKVRVGSQVYPGVNFLRIVNPEKNGVIFAIDSKEASIANSNDEVYFRPDAFPELLLACNLDETIPVALDIPGGRPDGRTLVNLKAKIASYPKNLKLGYSGTMLSKNFVENTMARISGSRSIRVAKKTLARKTSTTGEIKPASFTYIVSYVGGKLNSLEEEGKTVKAGQIIAKIDCEETAQSAKDTEIELKKKKEEILLLEEKNSLDEERSKKELEVKRGALEIARLKHSTLIKRRDEDKIIDLQRSLELVKARIGLASEKVAHVKELNKKGLRSEVEVMQAENEVFTLLKDKVLNLYKLKTEEAGPTKRSVKISELEVRKAELEKEKLELEASLGNLTNVMQAKIVELEMRKLEITLAKLNKKVEKAQIKSPCGGVIILNETQKSSGGLGKARVGDTIHLRVPFMQVVDDGNLQIHADVSEMDAKFIKLGDQVKILLNGNSVSKFKGWVSSVGFIAQTDFKIRQDAVVKVVIDLLSEKHGVVEISSAFRPGASCEVEFSLYNSTDTLFLPYDAMIPTASGTFVMSTARELLPVELLFSDGLNGIAIKSGVSEGQQLLLMEATND